MAELLVALGCKVHVDRASTALHRVPVGDAARRRAPAPWSSAMRASIVLLGPLLARCGAASWRCRAGTTSASGRSTSTSRGSRRWARRARRPRGDRGDHGGPGPPARRADHARVPQSHRHGQPAHGGGDSPRGTTSSTTPRASRRWRTSPSADRHGRADRGPRHVAPRHRGRRRAAARATTRSSTDRVVAATYLAAAVDHRWRGARRRRAPRAHGDAAAQDRAMGGWSS